MFKKNVIPWLFCLVLVVVLVMGADLKEKTGVTLLSSTTVAMGTNNTTANLYTVPAGKTAIVTKVIIHSLSGAVACGNDNDFGSGGAGWKDTVNLSTLDAVDDYWVITQDDVLVEAVFAAAAVFAIQTDIASSASAVNATVDVFGYLQ